MLAERSIHKSNWCFRKLFLHGCYETRTKLRINYKQSLQYTVRTTWWSLLTWFLAQDCSCSLIVVKLLSIYRDNPSSHRKICYWLAIDCILYLNRGYLCKKWYFIELEVPIVQRVLWVAIFLDSSCLVCIKHMLPSSKLWYSK